MERLPEVVVVAYGAPDLLGHALAPLTKHTTVTVVDNSSSADVRAVAETAGARYLDPGRNGGFAAGVNHGLRHRLEPDNDVLLLNPDAVIQPEALRQLHTALHAQPRTASIGPTLLNPDGVQAEVEWAYPSPAWTWADALRTAHRFTPRAKYVHGAVLLLNADAIAQVGPFDERFFLYCEETDWEYRAMKTGWSNRVAPHVEALHIGAATSPGEQVTRVRFRASHEYYLRKHHGATGWHLSRAAIVTGALVRLARPGGDRDVSRDRLALYARSAREQLVHLGDSAALAVVA